MINNTKRWLTAVVLCLGLFIPRISNAHGINSKFLGRGALIAEAHYSDGEPVSYAKVTVHSPKRTTPFQTGFADANGCFSFFPDELGKWTVIFQDGLGHRTELVLTVDSLPSINR